MSTDAPVPMAEETGLQPRLGLLQATALNMTNMVGVGPFITIPVLMTAMLGPQAMLGWLVALLIVIPDGMIWSELGAQLPGTGGTYVYLLTAFGSKTFGRFLAFLFIWQFIFSGPMEIATGYIGFAKYLKFLWPHLSDTTWDISNLHTWVMSDTKWAMVVVGIVAIALLYRRIGAIGALTLSLWIGTLLTMGIVIVAGVLHFNPHIAFDFPPGAFKFSPTFLHGLGAAAAVGVYDYLGYYDVCYIGEEVRNPGRVIPRSILISIVTIAVLYLALNLSIIGTVPWREFVPNDQRPNSDFVAAIFMQHLYGTGAAKVLTVMVLWTALGSIFALLLGYSRIPYAAARDGNFFPIFGRLHPKKQFPYVSLLVIGAISIFCSFFTLDTVINMLLVTRILVQSVGHVFAIVQLRKQAPDTARPYRIRYYPLIALLAVLGWGFLFINLGLHVIEYGLGIMATGVIFYLIWSWLSHGWPFEGRS